MSNERHRPWSRRECLKFSAAGLLGASVPWFDVLQRRAAAATLDGELPPKQCILLWMGGGPSQAHTFDNKAGDPVGSIETSVPGIRISEYMPKLAGQMEHLALLRTMSHGNFAHKEAQWLMSTGHEINSGGVTHPGMGAVINGIRNTPDGELPNNVTIDTGALGKHRDQAGYLGPRFNPLRVVPGQAIPDLAPSEDADPAQRNEQIQLVDQLNRAFLEHNHSPVAGGHHEAFRQALRLMKTPKTKAFELDDEPASLQDAYGRSAFGRGCLLARRLIEVGVPFVSVNMRSTVTTGASNDWDTHKDTAPRLKNLCEELDPAFATLLTDLRERDLLDRTLVIWMGEFGRSRNGVEHNNRIFTTALAGAGLKTGQAIGDTGRNGKEITEGRAIGPADFFATVCKSLDVDPHHEFTARGGRPMPAVDPEAEIVEELFWV